MTDTHLRCVVDFVVALIQVLMGIQCNHKFDDFIVMDVMNSAMFGSESIINTLVALVLLHTRLISFPLFACPRSFVVGSSPDLLLGLYSF